MKLISENELENFKKLTQDSIGCKIIKERKKPNDFKFNQWSPEYAIGLHSGNFDTGKYHFLIEFEAPESLTGLGTDSIKSITQTWELTELMQFEEDLYFHFTCWGSPPNGLNNFTDTMRYDEKQLLLPANLILNLVSNMMDMYPNDYSKQKLQNTIGFEKLSFQ